jgi:hypothetical protein
MRHEYRRCSQWTPKGPCKLPMNHGFAHDGIHGPEVNYGGHPWDDEDDDVPFVLARQVLKCPKPQPNDAYASTVHTYLLALLETLWLEGEGFSGKRPFGNSGWHYDVYKALGDAGIIDIEYDDDGDIEDVDSDRGDELIIAAIQSLRLPKKNP